MQSLSTRWHTWKTGPSRERASEPPLRAELFSIEQLKRHARSLAATHQIAPRHKVNRLLACLDANERCLLAFNRSTRSVNNNRRITPAAEWLLDNFYLIEQHIKMARLHLPHGYSRELPRLLNGPCAGFPRVYEIVLELVSHVDAQVDEGALSAFVAAYQTVVPLKLGELWAVPIMLRLALIENLQRITNRLTRARQDRDLADLWVDRLQDMAENDPSQIIGVVAEMAKSNVELTSSFVAEFCQRLSRHSSALYLARTWLENRLLEQGLSIERLVDLESQGQAANQVSVSHSISSLRFLGATDWKEFVETLSQVDETLRADPADYYREMDFPTRDRYRHVIETVARHSRLSETAVAQLTVQLAEEAARDSGQADRTAHIGYYLIDIGHSQLVKRAQVSWPWRSLIERSIQHFPLSFYVGGIAVLTLLATWAFLQQTQTINMEVWKQVFLTGVFLLGASQLAVALMNWLSMLLMPPRLLPRLDYSAGIVPECRTMVVVPTLLTSEAAIEHLIETLEIHYLANRDPHLHFALLTDFRDATAEHQPDDEALLQQVRAGILMLKRKYESTGQELFFLFHRPRRWNPGEGLWMGYERKRGKLAEFNSLLRGGAIACFSEIIGDTAILPMVKYVITLDTDTQLPRDAARRLVGTMAHPLNRPVFDAVHEIVAKGYGILQPRVGVSLPSSRSSWFVRLFACDAGIDPYTRAVSDVYQDLFQEGSFIGKGIYDVDAFQRAIDGRFPENTVLSHDLLEACHARSALVSDVEFYEAYPSRYWVDVDRRHRWMRGDWQITQWLLPRVPGINPRSMPNPLSGLSLWKIFDNLRRSLIPVAMVLFLLGGWMLVPELANMGLLLVLAIITLPGLLSWFVNVFRKPDDLPWLMHLQEGGRALIRQFCLVLLSLAFLPYDAYISLDAISRTLWRLLVTRKRLLEWQTSGDVERTHRADFRSYLTTMWIAPVVALASTLFLASTHPAHLTWSLPLLGGWLAAPRIAWWLSQPIESATPDLTTEQVTFLRSTARKTWNFFETFVTAEENWLPPDNFQEIPSPMIASRTSPTNMGLALLANLAAQDFGYLSVGGLIRRTQDALATMHRLERHHGHFYNWYDTRTLQPLLPHYVSSVDSGNLAGHLLTLGSGLRELAETRILTPTVFAGLRDTLGILKGFGKEGALLVALEATLAQTPTHLQTAASLLEKAAQQAGLLADALRNEEKELREWAQTLLRNCQEQLDDLRWLAPWLALPLPAPGVGEIPVAAAHQKGEPHPAAAPRLETLLARLDRPPTLRELAEFEDALRPLMEAVLPDLTSGTNPSGQEPPPYLAALSQVVGTASDHARQRMAALESLAAQSDEMAAMDFTCLFDPARDLFSIGFNVSDRRSDSSFYDLLASEARLCSYVAIALGQVPQDHWFSMGRLLVAARGAPILISWSGSMFEYLMPLLVMPSYENTLLDHTCKAAVRQQISYGKARGVPWGISESGYNRTDLQLNYQYRAFGVPGLGLKRGLREDLVIAPYATVMALMVAPLEACANLQRLAQEGRSGSYGFYEAVDYTPTRLPPDKTSITIRSYMLHHQGMSLLALANLLLDNPMQRRFMACPMLKAADLLLQERVLKTAVSVVAYDLVPELSHTPESEDVMRVFTNPTSSVPEVHLLSNGRYHVAISSAGGGYSRWRELTLTRWREDATRDHWGTFIYVRDLATGEFFSTAYQPVLRATDGYEAIFTQARAEFRQRHIGLEIHTEICVSPEDDVELRRLTLANRTSLTRVIEVTSYAEVVLASPAADAAHPAFSNLFVQTEFARRGSALLCTRRARSVDENPPWLLHLMVGENGGHGEISCETDRSKFVGRGGTLRNPAAMKSLAPLSNTVGSVLDPIVALRRTLTLPPHTSATIDLVWGVTDSRQAALTQVEKYQSSRMADRAFDLAWTHGQVMLHHLNATEAEVQLYDRLAAALIYANPARRANPNLLLANRRGQNGLWSHGISGDIPIILVHISDAEKIEMVRQLIQAHSYWHMKGLTADLVILYEDVSVYRNSLHEQINNLISAGIETQVLDRPSGIFVRRFEQIPNDDRVLLQAMARIVLDDQRGSLAEQLEHRIVTGSRVPALMPGSTAIADLPRPLPPRELIFQNGFGGFTPDGREYVITLRHGQTTPAPWVNVLANPHLGTGGFFLLKNNFVRRQRNS